MDALTGNAVRTPAELAVRSELAATFGAGVVRDGIDERLVCELD